MALHKSSLLKEFLQILKLNDLPMCDDFKKIDDLVLAAQQGDITARELAVRNMIPFMAKYYRIMKMGVVSHLDKDARRFLSMFIKDRQRAKAIRLCFLSSVANADIIRSAGLICDLFRSMDSEDIVQELTCTLLTIMKRWKQREGINFVGYMYASYRYEVYRITMRQMSNPLINGVYDIIPFEDDWETGTEPQPPEPNDDIFDDNWLNGIDCHEIFKSLTIRERAIVKMSYLDKMTDIEIGEAMGLHRHSIRKYRLRAELKLRGENAEDNKVENA